MFLTPEQVEMLKAELEHRGARAAALLEAMDHLVDALVAIEERGIAWGAPPWVPGQETFEEALSWEHAARECVETARQALARAYYALAD